MTGGAVATAGCRVVRTTPILAGLLVAVLALAPRAAGAQDAPHDGVYAMGARHPEPRPGTVAVTSSRGTEWAALGGRIHPRRALLYAHDNANLHYTLFVELAGGRACGEGVIVLGATALVSSSYGSWPNTCQLSFELSPPLATLAAQVFGIPRQDRRPAGEQVHGAFAPSALVYGAGEPVEIVLTLENPPRAPRVLRHVGGRQRGPRDNQFSFHLTRDGQPVAPVQGFDFGGLGSVIPMEPGARVVLRAPPDRWGDVSRLGRYVVECTYETSFSPDGRDFRDDAQRGAIWDRVFRGRVTFDVR